MRKIPRCPSQSAIRDAATGFSLEDPLLSEAYGPMDPGSVPMGWLRAAVGASFV